MPDLVWLGNLRYITAGHEEGTPQQKLDRSVLPKKLSSPGNGRWQSRGSCCIAHIIIIATPLSTLT